MATKWGIFAFIALIVAQETIAFPNLLGYFVAHEAIKSKTEQSDGLNHFHEPWLFTTGLGDGKPYEYLDEEGNIQGFNRDLMEEICKEAGQKCNIMFDDYNNCYVHEESGRSTAGVGILGRWYDGCMVFFKTPERVPLFSFSAPLYESDNPFGEFYVLNGNPSNFDPADVTGKRIGFLSGWSADENCIARDGRVGNIGSLEPGNKVYLKHMYKLVTLLRNKELDAIFTPVKAMPDNIDDLVTVGPGIECGSEDQSVAVHTMFKKGSPAVEWFNAALGRIKENGQYYKLCQSAETKHGGTPNCIV